VFQGIFQNETSLHDRALILGFKGIQKGQPRLLTCFLSLYTIGIFEISIPNIIKVTASDDNPVKSALVKVDNFFIIGHSDSIKVKSSRYHSIFKGIDGYLPISQGVGRINGAIIGGKNRLIGLRNTE